MKYNKILNDKIRKETEKTVKIFQDVCPDLLARKYPRANVQQAFGYEMFMHFEDLNRSSLFVGCFEDTAYEALKRQGFAVDGIDPVLDYSLESFVKVTDKTYDLILSISVIEHVPNDEEFIENICKLLNPGGVCIITMDYRNSAGNKPVEDYRLYNKNDYSRLGKILEKNNCALLDEFESTDEPDFQYGNCMYSFSTFVFRKNK